MEACTQNLIKSLLHNIGVVIVGFVFAFLGRKIDSLLGIAEFHSVFAVTAGCLFVGVGFVLRVWATFLFYERQMKVIKLAPQKKLITSGPYRFSRNPLYLGGNLFRFPGSGVIFRLTVWNRPYRHQSCRCGFYDPARRTTTCAGLRRRVAGVQEQGAPMALNVID